MKTTKTTATKINNRYVVESRSGILHYSWWHVAVICSPSIKIKNWIGVLKYLISVFGEVSITVMSTGEAIAFMRNEEQTAKLGNMTPLAWEGTSIGFRKWTPAFNSTSIDLEKPEAVMVSLVGIPIHLKKDFIVEGMIQGFGESYKIMQNNLDISLPVVKVFIRKPKWEDIPRCITLEERGYEFKVLVEVDRLRPLFLNILAPTSEEDNESTQSRTQEKSASQPGPSEVRSNNHDWPKQSSEVHKDVADHNHVWQQVKNVSDGQWVNSKPLDMTISNFEHNGSGTDKRESPTPAVDVAHKGKTVLNHHDVGQPSFFSPLHDLQLEEEAHFATQQCKTAHTQPNPGPTRNQKRRKPMNPLNWANGPGLTLSKQLWTPHLRSKRNQKLKRTVQAVLCSTSLGPSKIIVEIGSTSNSSAETVNQGAQTITSSILCPSSGATLLPPSEDMNKDHSERVSETAPGNSQFSCSVNECNTSCMLPPGFGQFASKHVQVSDFKWESSKKQCKILDWLNLEVHSKADFFKGNFKPRQGICS